MTELGVSFLVVFFIGVSMICGVIGRAIGSAVMPRATAFAWGSVLGPIGLAAVTAIRIRATTRGSQGIEQMPF